MTASMTLRMMTTTAQHRRPEEVNTATLTPDITITKCGVRDNIDFDIETTASTTGMTLDQTEKITVTTTMMD